MFANVAVSAFTTADISARRRTNYYILTLSKIAIILPFQSQQSATELFRSKDPARYGQVHMHVGSVGQI